MCLGLKEKGHDITVVTGKPNYPKGNFFSSYSFLNKPVEKYKGIKVYRSPIIPRGNVLPLLLRVPIINCLKKIIVLPPDLRNLALANNVSAP